MQVYISAVNNAASWGAYAAASAVQRTQAQEY